MLAGRVLRVLISFAFPTLFNIHRAMGLAPEPEVYVDKYNSDALRPARSLNYLGRSHLPEKYITPANQ